MSAKLSSGDILRLRRERFRQYLVASGSLEHGLLPAGMVEWLLVVSDTRVKQLFDVGLLHCFPMAGQRWYSVASVFRYAKVGKLN